MAGRMISNEKVYTFSRRLEWIMLLCLFGGAIYFQYESWTMYLGADTSFKIKEENIEEGPTLIFCPRSEGGYEIGTMVIHPLEHLTYHLSMDVMGIIIEGSLNTMTWSNKSVNVTKSTIKTIWGTCIMIETDFEDITTFVGDWLAIFFYLEDVGPDVKNQDINTNGTSGISEEWEGYDVYVTSKVEFVWNSYIYSGGETGGGRGYIIWGICRVNFGNSAHLKISQMFLIKKYDNIF